MALALTSATGAQSPEPLAACERRLAEERDGYDVHLCFFRAARVPELAAAARERLEALRRKAPTSGWPTLFLGHLAFADQDHDRALELYRGAADDFQARGEARGEVLARTNLRRLLHLRGLTLEAAEQVELASRAAEGSDDSRALARAWVMEANHKLETGGDLGRAYQALRRASEAAFPGGSYGLKRAVLVQLANLAFHLGYHRESIEAYERLEALMRAEGVVEDLAVSAFNRANARQAELEVAPDKAGVAELEGLVRRALELARRHDEPRIAAQAHGLLAQLLARVAPDKARGHVDACVELAGELRLAKVDMVCLWASAQIQLSADPAAALATSARAVAAADAAGNSLYRAHAHRTRMRAAWRALPAGDALAEGIRTLDAIEALRDAQRDAGHRARMIGNWTADYTWLAGRLLADRDDLAIAFQVIERLRGRVLLESLARRSPEPPADDPALRELRRRLAGVQRRLLDPDLAAESRRAAVVELERLELEERARRGASASAGPEPAHDATPVTLEQIRAALRPGEALLTFQLDLDHDLFGAPAGGSWVLVVTPEGGRAHRLPDRREIEPAVAVLRGLVERRDGTEGAAAGVLYGRLLGEALAALPPAVERLILVPDGALHQLPFALLRASAAAEPLGVRHELVVTPSATLWHRWRQGAAAVEAAAGQVEEVALVLADPTFPHARESAAASRNAILVGGMRLGRLPQARREGRAVRRHLGARLLLGEEASEGRLKAESLSRYGVLHFATHAVADAQRPERSCLVLAPGGDDEDGLLRAPEVAELDLRGRLVVLSACQTSSGALLRGEGVMSLARAFFEAEAHAVIGSRWPLRDADAALVFEAFYRHLAAGETAAAALREARRDAVAHGLPAEGWAGPVLLGSGDRRVVARSGIGWWWLAVGLVAVAGLASLARRGHPRTRGGDLPEKIKTSRTCGGDSPEKS